MIEIFEVDVNDIFLDEKNPKTHGLKSIDAIKKSIVEFGQYMPIVVNKRTNKILVGNGTYQAIRDLDIKTVKVVFVDLDEKDANKLSVLDNRTSELSEIDENIVEKFFYDLDENLIKITGYSNSEINEIMNKLEIESMDDQTEKANLNVIKCPYCKAEFKLESNGKK